MARKRAADTTIDNISLGWRDGEAVADFRDENHIRRRVRLGVRTKAEAAAALAKFVEARRAVKAQQSAHTIGDLWDMWMADRAKDGLSNAVYAAQWQSLREHFSRRMPDHLTADDCRAYARSRFEAGRAPATVHTELSRLRHCLQWAAKHKQIAAVPYIWIPAAGQPRQRVLTAAEAKRLMEGAHDPHVYLFIVLALSTGARHAAILDLTWDRIDFVSGLIQYDEALPPDPMHKRWRKGRATVPMNALARKALELAYSGRQSKFVIEHGGRRLKSIKDGFRNAALRAGLTDVTPHTVRHSVASWARERGVELGRIAQLLGHRDSRTTELVYSHPDANVYLGKVVEVIELRGQAE